ncbi:MAG: type II secretion system protein [Kiritimatiellia bacterium]|jgi:prepilin-type N-terminal cleavage/methylation domain-containing protein
MDISPRKRGFTLIELLVVIAIVAILSVLAIQKLGGVQERSKERVNLANLTRISSGIETYVAANYDDLDFNRLDALTMYGAAPGAANSTADLGSVAPLMIYTNQPGNVGLSSAKLLGTANPWAGSSAKLLGTYYLSEAEATMLRDTLGIQYIMRGTDGTMSRVGDDGAWAQGEIGNPDKCASVATELAAGLAVAVVNPGATKGRTPVGPNIYKACGENVAYTYAGKILVDDVEQADNEAAFKTLYGSGGILLAFGLGDSCSLIGNRVGGFDSAPVSPVMDAEEYRRYLVLVRIKGKVGSRGGAVTYTPTAAEFAGVLDPRGNTISMLR